MRGRSRCTAIVRTPYSRWPTLVTVADGENRSKARGIATPPPPGALSTLASSERPGTKPASARPTPHPGVERPGVPLMRGRVAPVATRALCYAGRSRVGGRPQASGLEHWLADDAPAGPSGGRGAEGGKALPVRAAARARMRRSPTQDHRRRFLPERDILEDVAVTTLPC